MNFRIGAGRYRIELELHCRWVWYRLPFIGQGHWTPIMGWSVDGWNIAMDDLSAGV